jgi:hypothetical protein
MQKHGVPVPQHYTDTQGVWDLMLKHCSAVGEGSLVCTGGCRGAGGNAQSSFWHWTIESGGGFPRAEAEMV